MTGWREEMEAEWNAQFDAVREAFTFNNAQEAFLDELRAEEEPAFDADGFDHWADIPF